VFNFFKKQQTEELEIDYDFVVGRINEIESQLEALKNATIASCYDINPGALESFGGLKLAAIRDKTSTESEINNKRKIFLRQFHNKEEYKTMQNEVDYILSYLYNKSYSSVKEKLSENIDVKLKNFIDEVKPLVETLSADNLMINELDNLEIEYNNLVSLKNKYERSHKR